MIDLKITDDLVECRQCGSDVCYQYRDDKHIRWQCMDCGFYTNTYMLKNSEIVNHLKETSPDLFNDISYLDDDNFVWYPMVINKPKIGIITPIGSCKEDWKWAFMPEVPIPFSEQYKYPVKGKPGEFHDYRVDINQMKQYEQLDFIVALNEANLLNTIL